jgi:hypothetical protein
VTRAHRLVALAVVCAAVGCTSVASPSPSPLPSSLADASPSADASPGVSTPELSPWQQELAGVEPDGTRSLESALALFAMAFGPIPGVAAPPTGAGSIGSASPAVRVVNALRDRLTDEQRAAVAGYLALSDDSRRIDVPAELGLRFAGLPGALALSGVMVGQDGYDPEERDLQRLGAQARRAAERFFGPMSAAPDGTSRISIRTTWAPNEPFVTFFNPVFGPSGFEKCDVHVNRARAADDRGLTGRALTLDVVHCYQSWKLGTDQGFDGNVPAWAWEGPAEYMMLDTFPPQLDDIQWWATYLLLPDVPLFERSYDAVGAYAQAFDAGVDLGEAFTAVLTDVDNAERFALAGLASNAFLDKWASEHLRNANGEWGPDWEFLSPGVTSYALRTPQQTMRIGVGGNEVFSQDAYSNHLYALTSTADVIRITSNGRVRIGDGEVDDLVRGGADYCLTSKGCGPCPDGSEPSINPTPISSVAVLAVSGGTDGTNGAVSGHALEEFCEDEEDEFCAAYRSTLHWWFREATNVGSPAWAAELARRFEEMQPLAPTRTLQQAVDVHIGLYTAHATLSGPELVQALVPYAEQMPGAVEALDSHCLITPADRGQ